MSKILNIGVAGCGYWGPNLVRNFHSLAGSCVRYVCDVSEGRLRHMRELYPTAVGTSRFDDLLEDAELDAVVVATPVRLHHPMAMRALAAGKHVYLEKPMAASSVQCQELNDLAARMGLVIMVGHTFLYSAPVRKIKEIVDAGGIGELCYLNARRLNLGLFQRDINVMWDLAPHDLSIILYIIGEAPLSVNCQGNSHVMPGVEDVVNLSLAFRNQRFATIQNSWLDPRKVREITIVGTRRMIVYDDLQPLEKIKIYDTRVERPPYYDSFAEFQYAYHYGDMIAPYVRQEEPLKVQCQHFLDCINHGRKPISGGQDGFRLVRILEAASASLHSQGAAVSVSWDTAVAGPAALQFPQASVPPGDAASSVEVGAFAGQ